MSNYQYSLRSLLILTALVSAFFALRSSYVFVPGSNVIIRSHQMPPLFATLAVAVCIVCLSDVRVRTLVLAGACASLLVAAALTIEIAVDLHRYGYWDWWQDLTTFVEIVGLHTFLGGTIGLLLGALRTLAPAGKSISRSTNGVDTIPR